MEKRAKREKKDAKKNDDGLRHYEKKKRKQKIEEINAITIDSNAIEILFMSSLPAKALATSDDGYSQDWILDSGAFISCHSP